MKRVKNVVDIRDGQYLGWLEEISKNYKNAQIKAATSVNVVMLDFYWQLGKDIASMRAEAKWGSKFFDVLSADLKKTIPNVKGFSRINLMYMKRYYELFSQESENVPQVVEHFKLIPWGHVRLIIDKCSDDIEKAKFYVNQTLENNWSRAVLMNFLDTRLYERQGKAVTNFNRTLPSPDSDLAQEITRDPYNFDFLAIRGRYDEKELKNALMDNIQRFLMELGTGFAFVGREYRLQVGGTEQFVDMLFYNINLRRYVVVEIKIRDFEPSDMGQIGTYVAAVDGILKHADDNPTIGLLICKTKDNVLAKYALSSLNAPVGVSEYQLTELYTEDLQNFLPSIEEIEKGLINN